MKRALVFAASLLWGCADTWAAGPRETASWFASPREPVVHVLVNGQGPLLFLVDTGANSCSLTDESASRLELTLDPEADAHGVRGVEPAHQAVLEKIVVGDVEAHDVRVVVVPSLGGKVDGILGYDFLKNYRTTIDYPATRVTFDSP